MLFNTCELQQKTAGQNTALTDCVLSIKWRHNNDVIVIKKFQYMSLIKFRTKRISKFLFWKLTEWCRFVTYLWNDPRKNITSAMVARKCGWRSTICAIATKSRSSATYAWLNDRVIDASSRIINRCVVRQVQATLMSHVLLVLNQLSPIR